MPPEDSFRFSSYLSSVIPVQPGRFFLKKLHATCLLFRIILISATPCCNITYINMLSYYLVSFCVDIEV
jgi:hypothetical protein